MTKSYVHNIGVNQLNLSIMKKIRRNSMLGKIIVYTIIPIIYIWLSFCWSIMKLGRGIYWFGNLQASQNVKMGSPLSVTIKSI